MRATPEEIEEFLELCDELYAAILISAHPHFHGWSLEIREGYFSLVCRTARQVRDRARDLERIAA